MSMSKVITTLSLVGFFVVAAFFPCAFPSLYVASACILIPTRFHRFFQQGQQYFLGDTCYWVHILAILLWCGVFADDERQAFALLWVLANGWVLLGILMWRNAMATWDFDRITSCWLHLSPALVTLSQTRCPTPTAAAIETLDWPMALRDATVFVALVFVLQWVTLRVQNRLESHLPNEKRSSNAYTYLTGVRFKNAPCRSYISDGLALAIVYVILHFVYLMTASLLAVGMSYSRGIHAVCCVSMVLVSIKNAISLHAYMRGRKGLTDKRV